MHPLVTESFRAPAPSRWPASAKAPATVPLARASATVLARSTLAALAMLGLAASSAQAQSWGVILDPGSSVGSAKVLPLDDGSLLVGANLSGIPPGPQGAWLVRMEPGGDVRWEATIEAGGPAVLHDVDVEPGGEACVLLDDVVARLRSDGTPRWASRLSPGSSRVQADPDGACVVAGTAEGSPWLARLADDGLVQWTRAWPPPPDGVIITIEHGVLPDGTIVVAHAREDCNPPPATSRACAEFLRRDGWSAPPECKWGSRGARASVVAAGDSVALHVEASSGIGAVLTDEINWAGRPGGGRLRLDWLSEPLAEDGEIRSFETYGSRVVSRCWRPEVRQEHDASGDIAWSREDFLGTLGADGTFVEAGATPWGLRVVRRAPRGVSGTGCVASPQPVRSPAYLFWADAWPALDFSTPPPTGLDIVSVPATISLVPTASRRLPTCGPCPSGAEADDDGDGVAEECDDCPGVFNPSQADSDGDGWPDGCDPCTDVDGDGLGEGSACAADPCPLLADGSAADADADGFGDGCDTCPAVHDPEQHDRDADAWGDACDDCPRVSEAIQADSDGDSWGDACDLCASVASSQGDRDEDGVGDECDACPDLHGGATDADADGWGTECDNCPAVPNPDQSDEDRDGRGDACTPLREPSSDPGALPFRAWHRGSGEIRAFWEDVGAPSYAVHAGSLQALASGAGDRHAIRCAIDEPRVTMQLPAGDLALLVTARAGAFESSAGRDSLGRERAHDPACP